MLLEYFQMIDTVVAFDRHEGRLTVHSKVPAESPVFEGHFPGMPIVPGVLLIETMAQAGGFMVIGRSDFTVMPFLMSVDKAKMRDFVKPETELVVEAELVHEGSGFAVTKGRITSAGKTLADCQLKFRTIPFDQTPLADVIRKRATETGLVALAEAGSEAGGQS